MSHPVSLIETSIAGAAANADRNAEFLFLATSGSASQPGVRTLRLRAIVDRSFLIFCSKFHTKWHHLLETRKYEVLLWYPSMGHQYRIRGTFREASPTETDLYWREQPDFSKRVDLAYEESCKPRQCIESAESFRSRVRAITEDVAASSRPWHFVAVWLDAEFIEVLNESRDRLHDCTQFHWRNGQWDAQAVVP